MKIWLNGEALETEAQTLAELVAEQLGPEAKVASALNDNFVPVSKRGETRLSANDRLEVLMPVQGG